MRPSEVKKVAFGALEVAALDSVEAAAVAVEDAGAARDGTQSQLQLISGRRAKRDHQTRASKLNVWLMANTLSATLLFLHPQPPAGLGLELGLLQKPLPLALLADRPEADGEIALIAVGRQGR